MPVNSETCSYGENTGGPSYYYYSNAGKLIKKTFERTDGFKTETYYLYSGDGLLVRAFRMYSNNKNALFRYSFDKNRRMKEKEFFMNDKIRGKDSFLYDSAARLLI